MSLDKLSQHGWYKAEATSPNEIAGLLTIVDRAMADLVVERISDDLRFHAAYNGILTLANISLRASGFRVSPGQGHHQRVIESLEYTLTTQERVAREKWVRKIKAHSQKRNTTSYDSAGGISPNDLAQIIRDLSTLREQVIACLKDTHPELLLIDSPPGS